MKFTVTEINLVQDVGLTLTVRSGFGSNNPVPQFNVGGHVSLKRWRTDMRDAENVAFSIIRYYITSPANGIANDLTWRSICSMKGRELLEFIVNSRAAKFMAASMLFDRRGFVTISDLDVQHAVLNGPAFDDSPDIKTKVRTAPSWLSEDIDPGRRLTAAEIMAQRLRDQGPVNPYTGKPLSGKP